MWFDTSSLRPEPPIYGVMPSLSFLKFDVPKNPEELRDERASRAHEALFGSPITERPSGTLFSTEPIGSMRWLRSKART